MFGHLPRSFAVAVAIVVGASAYAWPADPTQPVRSLTRVLAGQTGGAPSAAVLRSAVERSFAIDTIARNVLAARADDATPAQLVRFRAILTGKIISELRTRLRAGKNWTLDIVETRTIGTGESLVTSRVTMVGEDAKTIVWRVRTGGAGAVIVDVLGNGTSMSRVLRNDYDPALRRFGLDGVLNRVEARD